MRSFKKIILGAIFASMLVFGAPAQKANAADISFTPPDVEYYYTYSPVFNAWGYTVNPDFDEAGTLSSGEKFITYLAFDVTGSVFADTSFSSLGNLSIGIHDVVTKAAGGSGTLSLYRTNDASVLNPTPAVFGSAAPITLGDYLGQAIVNDEMEEGDIVNILFEQAVSATMVGETPWISFAVVGNNLSVSFLKADTGSFSFTPAPEPMSLTYILLGCGAFVIRRVKSLVGLA